MQIRILAGCKGLVMVLAIASFISAPAGAAAPKSKGTPDGAPQLSGSSVKQLDDSPKNVEPTMYARTNYVWSFSSGPVYATVDAAGWKTPGVLHTAVGSFDLSRGLPALPSELRAANKLASAAVQYYLLQVKPEAFTDGTFDQMKQAINAHGGSIVGEIPVAAVIVKLTRGAHNAIRDSRSIIALMPYQPAFKLSPTIGQLPLPNAARATSDIYMLKLQLFPGERPEALNGALAAMGARVTNSFGEALIVEVHRDKLAAIAALDAVFMVEEAMPLYLFSEETSTVTQTGKWANGATPYTDAGVDGGGLKKTLASSGGTFQDDDQILMIIDNGIQIDAGDLSHTKTSSGFDASLANKVIAGHRKIAFYGTTNAFGGTGDLLGCDGSTTSGVTHGHTVAVVALGNASRVDLPTYDPGGNAWIATDRAGLPWKLDGVAPKARLVAYDAQVTPFTGRCDDITQIPGTLGTGNSVLDPGPSLYTAPSTGPLPDSYAKGSRIANFSWGGVSPGYDAYSLQIDNFLNAFSDAMVFVAVGNTGRDANGDRIPDFQTIGRPAAAKNIIAIGASSNADDLGDKDLVERRWPNSSNGPATPGSQRIAPLLMAPGTDAGGQGLASEFHCRSNRNDNLEAVSCDVVAGQISTSFASAAAAGAGLLVRDYFNQGFYPDGTNTNATNSADVVSTISGALLKALLVVSADWMNQPGTIEAQTPSTAQFGQIPDFFGFTGNLSRKFRGNREQGFGRIQLTNVLPLQSSPLTITGLIIGDGGPAPAGLKNDTTLSLDLAAGAQSTHTLNVCDNTQPLTIAIGWNDPSLTDVNSRDLDLELVSPSGLLYLGNFFTDDINDNGVIGGDAIDLFEECTYTGRPWPANSGGGVVDTGPWSLPANTCALTCSIPSVPPNTFTGCGTEGAPGACPGGQGTCTRKAHADRNNNTEAIFLSADTKINGIVDDSGTSTIDEAEDNQIQQGAWTVRVKANSNNPGSTKYSIAIAGGVCQGSAARVQRVLPLDQLGGSSLTCNDSAVVTIDEIGTGGDPAPSAATVASRTTIQVIDANGVPVDTETLVGTDLTLVGSCSLKPTKACTSNPDCDLGTEGTCLTSPGNNFRYESKKFLLTDGTTPQSGNGALDARDGQSIRVTYQDANPSATRTGNASVSCKPFIASGGVLFAQFGRDAFTLVDGGCERDDRQPVGYFTFGFPDRYIDDGELVQYLLAFQSAEIGTDLLNVSVSLKAVNADSDSPASCKMGSAATAACTDPNRLNNTCASSHPNATPPVVCATSKMSILDSPKVYGRIPSGTTLTPSFTISGSMSAAVHKVDMIIGVTASTAGKGVETQFAKRESLNVDEASNYFSTDFPTGGTEPVGGYDVNNNETLEGVTYSVRDFFQDYFFETRAYSDLTATNPTLVALGAPWNFDTLDGGFRNGLNNTSRPQPLTPMSQWSEDKNFNGRLDGFCTGDGDVPCTQGIPKSVGCIRCSLNHATECSVNADCTAAGGNPLGDEGTCTYAVGTCNFAALGGEDRNINANAAFDKSWNTLGGCGWQSKFPGASGGGVWHTGLIRDPASSAICVAAGSSAGKCQQYWVQDDGDTIGDNNWWDMLLTPVLHKVRNCTTGTEVGCLGLGPGGSNLVDAPGDPVYHTQITDWAWNMLVDLPDTNTQVTLEFDTDINKTAGSELFNDAAILVQFRGKQGAVSGGNAPITNGFNMFHRINHCVDTDGNGSVDHCGTAQAKLCTADGVSTPTNFLCDGNDTRLVRGLCTTPTSLPAFRCTGNPSMTPACVTDTDCNQHCSLKPDVPCRVGGTQCAIAGAAGTCINNHTDGGERCVRPYIECSTTADCASVGGTCAIISGADLPRNREGSNNCYFHGIGGLAGGNQAKSAEPYGLPIPADDDAANGYCSRSDGFLSGLDKSASCTSANECNSSGPPYASVRNCTLWKTCTLATGKGCLTNADCALATEGTCDPTKPMPCLRDSPDCGPGLNAGTNPVGGLCTVTTFAATCNLPNTVADEFVQKNGPGRNYDIRTSNGPDMRFSTLEDIYGDTGNDFQAALGFNNREPDPITRGIPPGYGLAVDDMVVSWKETRLDLDTHTCGAGGECATLDSASTLSYEGNAVVSLTLIDKSPYDAVNNKNDCNGDGDYADAGDDQDCNNNGALDVTVGMTSAAETVPEIAVLDQTSPGSGIYKANFPYSTLYNSPGTLFVLQSGTSLPIVTARYVDRNDGTGQLCKNSIDPAIQGTVISTTTVAATSGLITLNSYSVGLTKVCSGLTTKTCVSNLDCNSGGGEGTCTALSPGDDDGFADAAELISLSVVLANKSGQDVDDIVATLGTNSPNIECITRASIVVGSLKNKELSNPANYLPFQFKVKNTANRTDPFGILQAKFTMTIRSNKFDALTRATEFTLDLDLNATGGGSTQAFVEDFEDVAAFPGNFGKFTREFLDANKRTRVLSKGFRCQYNNPFGVNSQSASNTDCFLGFTSDPSSGKNDWHIHTTVVADKHSGQGRARTGVQSLHLGLHSGGSPTLDTYTLKAIHSVKTIVPINIPLAGASPQLHFAQQVSFVDSSSGVNVSPGEGVDRGVVEVQRNTGSGPYTPQGSWIKIYPFENGYDQQGTDDFSNCVFDPTDDGNTETDFFDPLDPNRRLGPSSTCFPEFCFVHQGQTDYRKSFDQTDIGNASDGPGEQGCSGAGCLDANTPTVISNPGTWVRPRFDLVNFAASQLNIRFLYTSIEVGSTATMNGFFGRGDLSGDDGWYIDDIHIDQAIDTALTLSVDSATIASPLICGTCTLITAALDSDPVSLAAPGQIVTLSAQNSTADRCINGVLQYQFWNDVNFDATVGAGPDTLLRDWTDNSQFVAAPLVTTQYGVKVRCSTELSCAGAVAANTAVKNVKISCPGGPFPESITASRIGSTAPASSPWPITLSWSPPNVTVDIIRGSLTGAVPIGGAGKALLSTTPHVGFNDTVDACIANNNGPTSSFIENSLVAVPALLPGQGFYYLVRGQVGQKYTSGHVKERNGPAGGFCNGATSRDTELALDATACSNP